MIKAQSHRNHAASITGDFTMNGYSLFSESSRMQAANNDWQKNFLITVNAVGDHGNVTLSFNHNKFTDALDHLYQLRQVNQSGNPFHIAIYQRSNGAIIKNCQCFQ